MTQTTIGVMVSDIVDAVIPVEAIHMGGGIYKLLPTDSYDAECDDWQFLPGALVRCSIQKFTQGDVLVASEQVEPPPYASEIYVKLIESDGYKLKKRKAVSLGNQTYRLLPAPAHKRAGEWEFPTGALVRCEYGYPNFRIEGFVAIERVG